MAGSAAALVRDTGLLVLMLVGACGGDPPAALPGAPDPVPPSHAASPGKALPAPASEVALGRAVLETLRRDDWEGYANLLVTRADMLDVYGDEERGMGRDRRKRRRMVWRHVNRLRDGEAERAWNDAIREARRDGMAWDAVRLVDVRRDASPRDDLPPGTTAARLELVIAHADVERVLALGTCLRSSRGWVVMDPLAWRPVPTMPQGESLLRGDPAPPSGTDPLAPPRSVTQ